jgi:hypothetical protein
MRTVYVRYKNPFSRNDAKNTAMYLSELLRLNPNGRFYLIIAENRMFAVGAKNDEKSERWRVKRVRHIRDNNFVPYFLYFSPEPLPQCEYMALMYGGIMGEVERKQPATPLHFYLLEGDLRLNTEQRQAGAVKEVIWDVFRVENTDGTATIRPLLSDENAMLVIRTRDLSFSQLYNILFRFVADVFYA